MNIAGRRWIAVGSLLVTLMLTACSAPRYEITASFIGGQIFLDAHFRGFWPFKWSAEQVEANYLEVVSSTQILWAIQASENHECTTPTENSSYKAPTYIRFPLAFGVTPHCYVTLTPAQPISQGTPVLIRARGGVTEGFGQFELRGHEIVAVSNGQGVSITAPTQNPRWQAEIDQAVRAAKVGLPRRTDTQ